MNIFYTNSNPVLCAAEHCHVHLNKMLIEYAQLLSTAHRVLDGTEYIEMSDAGRRIKRWQMENPTLEQKLYKATHVNHPSNKWVRDSMQHYEWLFLTWREMQRLYFESRGVKHGTSFLLRTLDSVPHNIPFNGFVSPYVAIQEADHPDIHEHLNSGQLTTETAYQEFVNRKFASWINREGKRKIVPHWNHSKVPPWVVLPPLP